MDSKLRCVFHLPADGTVQNNNLDTSAAQGEDKTAVNKVVADSTVKSYPKTSNSDLELKKLADGNKKFKEEIHQIKQDNSQLKAEGLRLRSRGSPTSDAGSQLGSIHPGKNSKTHFDDRLQEQSLSPMLYLAVMLTIGLLSIFLGKFVV
ncbi:vesicle-associated membrane protein-associated protein A [Nephila pilipes]|uniref:Vesicle-associated membrane protein-associated protein A n=1 Tax=Nephila pilipes TaxID=299642 RepID=A0A8X6TYS6_NEPPI|nr:vesicle-associated membrane protein-associated protein A [Nephila pilipes]